MTYPQHPGQHGQQPYGAQYTDPFQNPGAGIGGPSRGPRNRTLLITVVTVVAAGALTLGLLWILGVFDDEGDGGEQSIIGSTPETSAPATAETDSGGADGGDGGEDVEVDPDHRRMIDDFVAALNNGDAEAARSAMCTEGFHDDRIDGAIDRGVQLEVDYSTYEESVSGGGLVLATDRTAAGEGVPVSLTATDDDAGGVCMSWVSGL
ncbi:hypothetical protein BJF85_08060 [Saccharomonospora sp. CUA-673]|uniref:hypothetical protein n=1 Tax=Saccharomonospora sp. CUA-673 TaxID=1904969 RepID=UPI000960D5DB|nr:hypothetical protein [Saccharomonospora sp. CUA-673]OLT38655.1 hypothetical protein BJF85_08060 [Saccharomonospora sp. CUA-673]